MTNLAVEPLIVSRPEHWGVTRLKAALARREVRKGEDDVPLMSLASTGAVRPRSEGADRQQPSEDAIPRYLVAEPGDLIVNPMWLAGGGIGVSQLTGAVSPDYRVFRSRGELLPAYAHHLLRSVPFLEQYRLFVRADTTFDRRVQQVDLDNLRIPVPPLDEQRRIADFLDDQVPRIESSIRQVDSSRSLVEERTSAYLGEQLASVGEATTPLSSLATIVDTEHRTAPETPGGEHWSAGTSSIRHGYVLPDKLTEVDKAAYAAWTRRSRPTPGDVLLTREAPVGQAAILKEEHARIAIGQRVVLLKPHRPALVGGFLLGYLLSPLFSRAVELLTQGSLHPHLNMSDIYRLRLPAPALSAQRLVAEHVDLALHQRSDLLGALSRQGALLLERKRALITAAVTGEFDVSTASGRNVA